MNEVSCRALDIFFHALRERDIDPERLVEGLPVSLDDLRRDRIDWDLHVTLLERLELLCGGPDSLEAIGASVFDSSALRAVRAISFFFGNVRQLYWMGCRWVGPSFFSNIRYAYRELADGRVELSLELSPESRPCPQLFSVTAGTLRATPRLMGLREDADLDVSYSSHRAVYRIRPPRSLSFFSLLRRVTKMPFAAWTAIEELGAIQAGLNESIDPRPAPSVAEKTRPDTVDTVDQLGRELLRVLDSERLPDQLLGFLIKRFHWKGASLWMTGANDEQLVFYGRVGSTLGKPTSAHRLAISDRSIGRLDVWEDERRDREGEWELIEKLMPWIAVTVQNAQMAASMRSAEPAFQWVSKTGEDVFLIVDHEGHILYSGPGSDDVLGYEREDLIRMDATDLVHPDDWPRLLDVASKLSKHSSSAMYSSARIHHRNGSWRKLEGVAVKVMSDGGSDVFLISAGETRSALAPH
jgi:PAS domain S-box-containing protein